MVVTTHGKKEGAGKMAQRIRVLATKTEHPSSNPRTHREREN